MLVEHGAVSAPVAARMADGVRAATGATYGVSTTGIAGPGGGSPAKPVGEVFIGCAGPEHTTTRELHLPGNREAVRTATVTYALHLLREEMRA
jgi:PncC family amidohydrolase